MIIKILFAESPEQLRRCHPTIAQLRPHLNEESFVAQAQRQALDGGYRIAFLEADGVVRAVAGFRVWETLFSGRHMYVDDLVTDESVRSHGHGGRLFDWLVRHARAAGCATVELDSGTQRKAAHRFYLAKRMEIESFHFRLRLESV